MRPILFLAMLLGAATVARADGTVGLLKTGDGGNWDGGVTFNGFAVGSGAKMYCLNGALYTLAHA